MQCRGQESVVKTVNPWAHGAPAQLLLDLIGSPRGASRWSPGPIQTVSCLNTYFHWEGKKELQCFNQNLTNRQAFDNGPRCPFILLHWRVCWLMSPTLILLFGTRRQTYLSSAVLLLITGLSLGCVANSAKEILIPDTSSFWSEIRTIFLPSYSHSVLFVFWTCHNRCDLSG